MLTDVPSAYTLETTARSVNLGSSFTITLASRNALLALRLKTGNVSPPRLFANMATRLTKMVSVFLN